MAILLVEFESYKIREELHIKEICIIPLLSFTCGPPYVHRILRVDSSLVTSTIDKRTCDYIYRNCHQLKMEIPHLDKKKLPDIPSGSLLLTHGVEKARHLRKVYPHCCVLSYSSSLGYDKYRLRDWPCPSGVIHGKHCAYSKCKNLQYFLLFHSML